MRDNDSLILESLYLSMIFESVDDQKRQSQNLLIASVVGRDIWKNKNKPENKETIEKARIETEPIYNKLLSIVEPYQSDQYAKNMAHLPELTKFYLQIKDLDLIEKEYKSYMSLGSLKVKNTIKKEQDFLKWTGEIHKIEEIERVKKEGQIETPKEEDKIVSGDENQKYEDENVIVFLANNVNDPKQSVKNCVKYGKGSSLCISGSSARTYYHSYRWRDKLTTYFIWLKKENRYILVDVGEEDGEYQYNNVKENDDIEATKKEIIDEYPVLKKPFDENIFVSVPIEGKELEFYTKFYNAKSISVFNSLEDRLNYASFNEISDKEFESIPEEQIPIVLKAYIESGVEDDIGEELLNRYPALKKRYWQKKFQNLEREFEEWDVNDVVSFSDDEWRLIINQNIDVPQNVMESILKTAAPKLAYQYLKNDKEVPIELENDILKSPSSGLAYLEYCFKNDIEVSERSLRKVAETSNRDYIINLCRSLKRNEKDIPDYILDAISKDPKASLNYIYDVVYNFYFDLNSMYSKIDQYKLSFEEIPENILKSILTNSSTTFDLMWKYVIPIYIENIPNYIRNSQGFVNLNYQELNELMNRLIKCAIEIVKQIPSYRFDFLKIPYSMLDSIEKKGYESNNLYDYIRPLITEILTWDKEGYKKLNDYFGRLILSGGSELVRVYLTTIIESYNIDDLNKIPKEMLDKLSENTSSSRKFTVFLVDIRGMEIPDKLYDGGQWSDAITSRYTYFNADNIFNYLLYHGTYDKKDFSKKMENVERTTNLVKNRPEICLDIMKNLLLRLYENPRFVVGSTYSVENIFKNIPKEIVNGVFKNQKTKKTLNEISEDILERLSKRQINYEEDVKDFLFNHLKPYLESLYEKTKKTLSESYIGLKTFKKFVSNKYI
jgi:Icc-related predicted phosphoesterase